MALILVLGDGIRCGMLSCEPSMFMYPPLRSPLAEDTS